MTGIIMALTMVFYSICPAETVDVGRYYLDTKQIQVCQNFEENDHILYHESAHWIYFNKLSNDERNMRQLLSAKHPYVTAYASTMAEEDRAEEGRIYFQQIKKKNTVKRSFVRRTMVKYGFILKQK